MLPASPARARGNAMETLKLCEGVPVRVVPDHGDICRPTCERDEHAAAMPPATMTELPEARAPVTIASKPCHS
jgi:hypothetical protein